jgi:hypothetical protein
MQKNTLVALGTFLLGFVLSGCSGGVSGENGDDPFGSGGQTPAPITLVTTILDAQCESTASISFQAGQSLCVRASLPQSVSNRSGQIIEFSTPLGTLATSSRVTDSNGIADVLISSTTGDIGAASVTATFNNVSSQANYEFLAPVATPISLPSLALSVLKNGVPSNRFTTDEQVTLQAQLNDNTGNPIAGEIVNFSVGKGLLNTGEALTNNMGVAQVLLSANGDLGASVITINASINGQPLFSQFNFEIQAADIIEESMTRVGHFNQDGVFIENELGVSINSNGADLEISAGGTLGFSIALVDENDNRIITPVPVSFTSNCVQSGQAQIDQTVNTINGVAESTYEDISCAGGNGNSDTIVASVNINNTPIALSKSIDIQAESVGSISFVSATPTQIVLQGTGGQNNQTLSTLVFKVTGALGNPLPQKEVSFSLNTDTGGLTLAPLTGITNSQGEVSTRVTSGNVPTAIRVTAEITTNNGSQIQTQSDLLAVNTGLPDQNSMTLSATNLNPEADQRSGEQVTIVARLGDSFNNPVPDGTSVSFTTEGGTIQPSCTTVGGTCSVTWEGANPRAEDNRITILATAIGHETLLDSNGNNVFDDADGGPLERAQNSMTTGFEDLPEAWRDDNEDNMRNPTEIFLDYNNDGSFSPPDRQFNGPHCQSGTFCGSQQAEKTVHVRKSLFLVMSSSDALWSVYKDDVTDPDNLLLSSTDSQRSFQIPDNESTELILVFTDLAGQVMPSGTQLGSLDPDNLIDNILFTVPNTNRRFENGAGHTVRAAILDTSVTTVTNLGFSFVIQAPSGQRTLIDFVVNPN